jgi:alcohol dehydrogenase class IV
LELQSFVYEQLSHRVIFGAGALDRLADEATRAGIRRALVVTTPDRRFVDQVVRRLGSLVAGVYAGAVMHVPIETAADARAQAQSLNADGCVAVGGGSSIGLAKAIALDIDLPIIAVPTTYAGSEMTSIYGVSEGGVKRTGRDHRVLPRTVLYDPALTVTLPPRVAGPSGMNALAHCVEALYAQDANPVINLVAAEGIRALAHALPEIVRTPGNLDARSEALYGAWLAGTSLGAVGMAIHHKLCHTLGGSFGLPHADVHSVILPHAAAFNRDAAPDAMRAVATALGEPDAPQGLFDLAVRIGAPTSLKAIGMPESGLDRAAMLATQNPYYNPRPIDYAGVRVLLENAYYGRRP